jgi:RNA polymerase sigma-70 factor (ECF subfamily)
MSPSSAPTSRPAGEPPLRPAPAGSGAGDDPALERVALAVQAGCDGERNFRLLFERFHRPVERFFARRGVRPEDCLDLTQETFLCIYRGLENYRSEGRLSHWVLRIAATTYLQWVRASKAAKRTGRETPPEEAEEAAPALRLSSRQLDALLEGELRLALRRAVGELPDQMRNCLLLRLDRELSTPEIATLMRLAPDTVKAHLFQARRRLKERLGAAAGAVLERPA